MSKEGYISRYKLFKGVGFILLALFCMSMFIIGLMSGPLRIENTCSVSGFEMIYIALSCSMFAAGVLFCGMKAVNILSENEE